MAKEYIERDALKQRLGDLHFQGYGDAILAVLEAPAADVVEVVWCKDCRKNTTHCHSRLGFRWCNKWGNIVRETDFCSYGERRGNNGVQ